MYAPLFGETKGKILEVGCFCISGISGTQGNPDFLVSRSILVVRRKCAGTCMKSLYVHVIKSSRGASQLAG